MFDAVSRSWGITLTSFRVILQQPEILAFPVMSVLFSFGYSVALLAPTLLVEALESGGLDLSWGPLQYAASFVTYLGLAFIATFFNTCVVHTSRAHFSGATTTMGDSLVFAVSRVHQIFAWSLVSATLGILLKALDEAGDRAGPVGTAAAAVVHRLIGLAWSISTIFVVPVMVYENAGPIDAIKGSMTTLKRTWGESLARHYGLGVMSTICAAPGLVVLFVGYLALSLPDLLPPPATPELVMVAMGLALAWLGLVFTVFSVAGAVFNTALYEYASTGQVPGGYDERTMKGAFALRARA